jgi:hypothetical protein
MNKKIYNSPIVEVGMTQIAYALCQPGSYTEKTGDPIEANPNEGI